MDLRARIGTIRVPTLVVPGPENPAAPPDMGEEILSLVPGTEFIAVPEAAHMISVGREDTLTALIRSLLGGRHVQHLLPRLTSPRHTLTFEPFRGEPGWRAEIRAIP